MSFVRVLIIAVLCAVLLAQAQRFRGLRYRPWSMLLGAVAFGVLAIGNLLPVFGVSLAGYELFAVGLPVLLLLASVVLLGLSWRAGEMRSDVQQARSTLADEIKRRQR